MISPVFAHILRSAREPLNAQFTAARKLQPNLEGDVFLAFLADAVDPVVIAVDAARPSATSEVALVAYEIALELAGQRLIGPGVRQDVIRQAWLRVLPVIPQLVASAPRVILAALSNAVLQISATPGARANQWIEDMQVLGARCSDASEWLQLGQVAAWRAGLAHYRTGALAAADILPEATVLALLHAREGSRWSDLRDRLHNDPWFDPGLSVPPLIEPRFAKQAGAFRGFGGVFQEHPLVLLAGDHLLATSGDEGWLLTADVFGATFHRSTKEELAHRDGAGATAGAISFSGTTVRAGSHTIEVPQFGEITSAAMCGATLALTARNTYGVILFSVPVR